MERQFPHSVMVITRGYERIQKNTCNSLQYSFVGSIASRFNERSEVSPSFGRPGAGKPCRNVPHPREKLHPVFAEILVEIESCDRVLGEQGELVIETVYPDTVGCL